MCAKDLIVGLRAVEFGLRFELMSGVRRLLAITLFVGQSVALGLPGDLDSEFQLEAEFNALSGPMQITSLAASGGLPTIQLGDGTVLRLNANGKPDVNFARSVGDPGRTGYADRFPMHMVGDEQILLFNPVRVIGVGGEVLRRITSDGYRPDDGAILADGSFVASSPWELVRLPEASDRFEFAESFLTERDLGSRIHFKSLQDDGWLVIGQRSGGALGTLSRLLPDGTLDEGFQPERSRFYDAAMADDGAIYVVRKAGITREVVRVLEDGSLDSAFTPFMLPETSPRRWEIQAIAFDPTTGGLFVGAGRERTLDLSDLGEMDASLYFLDSSGNESRFFTENAAVVGSVRNLARIGDKLYVLGDLRKRDAEELTARLVRLDARLSGGAPPLIVVSPKDTTGIFGQATQLSVEAVTDGALKDYQWFKDGRRLDGATQAELVISKATFEDSGDYSVMVTASGLSVVSDTARLAVSGEVSLVDPEFGRNLDLVYDDPTVLASASVTPLADGTVLLRGSFTSVNGVPSSRMVRLQANGDLDDSFPVDHPMEVSGAKLGPNDSLYGRIFDAERQLVSPIGRRTADGDFEPFALPEGFGDIGRTRFLVQPEDGKVVVPVRNDDPSLGATLFRFLPDGSVDGSFGPVSFAGTLDGLHASIADLVRLGDGKILVGGRWGDVNGIDSGDGYHRALVRLNRDGSLDKTFLFTALDPVQDAVLQLQSVGDRVLVFSRFRLMKIDGEGRVDESFQPELGLSIPANAAYLGRSGEVFVEHVRSRSDPEYPNLAYTRLLQSGALGRQLDFVAGSDGGVRVGFAPHVDGVLVGGRFQFIEGVYRPDGIARLRPIDNVPVVFADARLESAVQAALGMPEVPVLVKMLAGLTELHLDDQGIRDLRGLENARHLQVLSLNDNAIIDLTPLAALPLTNLSATNNAIVSLPESFDVDVLTLEGNPIAGGPAISLGRVPTTTRYEPGPNGSVQAHVEYEWVLEMATEVGYHFRLQASSDLRRWESVPGHENVVGEGLRYRVSLPVDSEDWRYFRRVAARPQ